MCFGIEKCKVLTRRRGRIKYSDKIRLPNNEHEKEINFSCYEFLLLCLGILQDDQIIGK